MRGARAAISYGLHHIEAQVDAIESSVAENHGLVFDLSRTLVESTCRTILTERGISYSSNDDLPRLFRIVKDNLPMLPAQESHAVTVRDSIALTLRGISTVIQGISELRNQLSFASHGGDRPRPSMDLSHAVLAAQSADTIVGFLYLVHASNLPSRPQLEFSPNRDSRFDSFVDDQHDLVRILDAEFLPSDILFEMEPNSYRIFRADFLDESQAGGEEK